MKATCKRESLLEALDQTKPCKGKGQSYLATREGHLVVFTGDSIALLMVPLKATVGGKGQAALSNEAVAFLKTATGSQVVLSTVHKDWTEDVELERARMDYTVNPPKHIPAKRGPKKFSSFFLKLQSGNNSASFSITDPKDIGISGIAEAEKIAGGDSLTIRDFGHAVKEVAYATKSEEQACFSVLNGVGMIPSPKGIELVGCDGIRMAVTTIKTKAQIPSVTIKSKAADILAKAERVKFWHKKVKDGTWMVFRFNGMTMLTASMGKYAEIKALLPETTRKAVSVYSDDLREAIGTAMTTVGRQGAIRLMGRGKTLRVVGMVAGAVSEAKIASRGRIQQAYEARYLLDVLSRTGEVVDIRLPVSDKAELPRPLPAVIKCNGNIHMICAREVSEWDPKVAKATKITSKAKAAPALHEAQEDAVLDGEGDLEGEMAGVADGD